MENFPLLKTPFISSFETMVSYGQFQINVSILAQWKEIRAWQEFQAEFQVRDDIMILRGSRKQIERSAALLPQKKIKKGGKKILLVH